MADINLSSAEERMRINGLLDCYGALLTEKQRAALEKYFQDDLSLAEISELNGISRQGVRDSLHRGAEILRDAENKLGFYVKHTELRDRLLYLKSVLEKENLSSEARSITDKTIGDLTDGI